MLECLLAADGRPVPAEELLERVWDEAADPFTSTVKTTIGRLRAKLGDPPVIETVRESGYRIGGALSIPARAPVPAPPAAAPPHRPAAPDRPVRRGVPGLRRGRARGRHLPALRVHQPERTALQPGESSASAAFNSKIPSADVHQAGQLRHRPGPRPVADVQQAGRYDIVISAARYRQHDQKPPVLTAAQQAKVRPRRRAPATAQVQVNYDKQADPDRSPPSPWRSSRWPPPRSAGCIAGRVLRPLSTITAAARRIAASSLHERLALHGPDDELKELADTLDNLFARLEASFDAQRRFAANASHELRTPLTRERTLLQVTRADPASTTEHLAGRQPGTARLQRRAGTPDRGAAHPGQRRSRRRRARARSTWPSSPAPPWPRPAPRSAAWACTSRPTSSPPSSTATPCWSSSW